MADQPNIQKVTGIWICLGQDTFGEGNTPEEAFRAYYNRRTIQYACKTDCRFLFAESFIDNKDV